MVVLEVKLDVVCVEGEDGGPVTSASRRRVEYVEVLKRTTDSPSGIFLCTICIAAEVPSGGGTFPENVDFASSLRGCVSESIGTPAQKSEGLAGRAKT